MSAIGLTWILPHQESLTGMLRCRIRVALTRLTRRMRSDYRFHSLTYQLTCF
nr:MAG TPA: hypothetical protein [Caudoviricetes sp.]